MRVAVVAVGRLGRAPETALATDYLARAAAGGRALGFGAFDLIEVDGKRASPEFEGPALLARLEPADRVIACDERGRAWPSRDFAARLGAWRDRGVRRAAFLIGGADGLSAEVSARADETLAFGVQTWPHALVRVLLAEQLYRATTILAGSPYHRD